MATPGSGDPSGPSRTPAPGGHGRGALMSRRLPASLSPGRLPSMRSRDVTLGGVKKKTFTPNIIGRKSKEELKVNEGQRRERKETERGRNRDGRGRGRGRPEVIQSHSIFEQGPAEMMAKRRGVYDEVRETAQSGPSPIINIKKEKRETEEETKEILRKLERDSFLDDAGLRSDVRSCPVQLPLAVSGWVFKDEFSDEVKPEVTQGHDDPNDPTTSNQPADASVKVKQEPPDIPEVKKVEPTYRPPPLPEPDSLPMLLEVWHQCKEEELLLIQLPDSLPGQPPTRDTRPTRTEVLSEDGQSMLQKTEPQEELLEESGCSLRELQQGLLGRLQVRRSGQVQLLLGSVSLDVALGTCCSFLQELVSVGTEGRRGDMCVLGRVKQKLVCSPDFQALLENRA